MRSAAFCEGPQRREHLPGARRAREARGVPRSRRPGARRLRRPPGHRRHPPPPPSPHPAAGRPGHPDASRTMINLNGTFCTATTHTRRRCPGPRAVGEVELVEGVAGELATAGVEEEGEVCGGQDGPVSVGVGVFVGVGGGGRGPGPRAAGRVRKCRRPWPVRAGGVRRRGWVRGRRPCARSGPGSRSRCTCGSVRGPRTRSAQVGVGLVGELGEPEGLAVSPPVGALDKGCPPRNAEGPRSVRIAA